MKKEGVLSIITYLIIVVFLILYIIQRNYEFIFYNVLALIIFWIVLYFYKRTKMPFIVFVGFVVWLFFHMLGGLDIVGQRVYGVMLLNLVGDPYYLLRYDQLVHFYCYIVVGAIVYYIFEPYLKKPTNFVLFLIAIAASGVGVLNEMFEFLMVLILGNTGVGDYYNTMLDLVSNTLGALVGVFWSKRVSLKK